MDGGFSLDQGNHSSPEIGEDQSPPSSTNFSGQKTTTSPKKSRRSIQKRVVSIPIKDVEGISRLKGESAPPSDSWAWRKYGQKPIKGSPYPRGYYRCSSSKGCPARKQVERSRVDPTLLMVTYSSDHNHPWPAASRNHHHNNHQNTTRAAADASPTAATTDMTPKTPTLCEPDPVENFTTLSDESLAMGDEFGWFADMSSTSSTRLLESPVFAETSCGLDVDMAMYFPIKEEDESLFADLGELPECSVVFRRGLLEEGRRCTSSPWCGTT